MPEQIKFSIFNAARKILAAFGTLLLIAWSGLIGNGASDLVRGSILDTYKSIFYRNEIMACHQGILALIAADKEKQNKKYDDAQRDYIIAVDRLTFAANGGIPRAMAVLHELYCVGRSGYVQADPALGERWGALAVSKGDTLASFKC